MGVTRVVLHIDRLRVEGVERAELGALSSALRGELERALSHHPPAQNAPIGSGALDALRLAPVRVPAGVDARGLGRACGRALARGLAAHTAGPVSAEATR